MIDFYFIRQNTEVNPTNQFMWYFGTLASCDHKISANAPDEMVSDRLDRLRMTDLEGHALTMADFAGKAVFLNFWAT
ncbi:MAG: hypothetical protein K9I85_15905 [Saprospiraceae bacterium]|nr:hypothetical protein [Saprospiraceae bacterium]